MSIAFRIINAFLLMCAGCSTTHVDWEETCAFNTPRAYQTYILKHPDSPYSEEARRKLDNIYYTQAMESATVAAYSQYLARSPQGAHAQELRTRIITMRKQDRRLVRTFPSWLKKGVASDPNRKSSWFLDTSYIGILPSDIGRGYKAAGDDPEHPMELFWEGNHLIYFGGCGVIVGPDGLSVLVGYP